jgi:hypothetical protein
VAHTKISLQHNFHGIDPSLVATMVGGNLLRAYRFDEQALRSAAGRVGPTVDDLASPPEPESISYWASKSPSFVAA